ncbi:MAG: hypothetical protein K2O62_03065, partial [Clostridia bacterium]|nr:hypothetical protein [Clostridia bacterium]
MKKKRSGVNGIVVVALCDFVAITMAALIAVLAGNLEWTLKILWWYLANLSLSYVFLILFRMYYFTFDTVGLIDTL